MSERLETILVMIVLDDTLLLPVVGKYAAM